MEEGDPIGTVGASADAVTKTPHVHLGIRVALDPNGYVDPLALLPRRPDATVPPPPSTTSGVTGAPSEPTRVGACSSGRPGSALACAAPGRNPTARVAAGSRRRSADAGAAARAT